MSAGGRLGEAFEVRSALSSGDENNYFTLLCGRMQAWSEPSRMQLRCKSVCMYVYTYIQTYRKTPATAVVDHF